jgi:hypothetical protein
VTPLPKAAVELQFELMEAVSAPRSAWEQFASELQLELARLDHELADGEVDETSSKRRETLVRVIDAVSAKLRP